MSTVAASALLVPASATAGAWTRPATLAGPSAPTSKIPDERVPAVAVNRRGESIAAWAGMGTDQPAVLVATGDTRGRFGRPQRVGRGLLGTVAIADDGSAVVAWLSGAVIKVAGRARHGRFGRPQVLSAPEPGFFDVNPVVAVRRDGAALVAWSSIKGSSAPGDTLVENVRTSVRRSGGRFGAARTVGAGHVTAVAFDGRGRAIASWHATTQSGGVYPIPLSRTSVAQISIGTVGGHFAMPLTVSSSPTYDMRTAVGTGGEIALSWERAQGPESQPYGPIQTAIQLAGGGFEAPVNAPVERADRSFGPLVAFGERGELVTVWQEKLRPSSDRSAPLYWAARRLGAAFSPRQALSAVNVSQPLLAATGDGRALMVWSAGRLRSALYRSATGFTASSAPRGRIAASRASRLAAAGDFAAFAWRDSDGRLRASVRKLAR